MYKPESLCPPGEEENPWEKTATLDSMFHPTSQTHYDPWSLWNFVVVFVKKDFQGTHNSTIHVNLVIRPLCFCWKSAGMWHNLHWSLWCWIPNDFVTMSISSYCKVFWGLLLLEVLLRLWHNLWTQGRTQLCWAAGLHYLITVNRHLGTRHLKLLTLNFTFKLCENYYTAI